ncbi:Uncharacterised protein g5341 [Pycnogonum litorale]
MNESWHDSCPPVDRSFKNMHVQRSINGYCFDESEMPQFVIVNDYQPVKSSDFCISDEKILHVVAEACSMIWKRPSTSAIKELISNKKHLDVDIYSWQCNKCNYSEPSRNVSDLRINEHEHGGNDVDPCEFFICDDRTFLGDGNTKFSKESRDYIPYSSSDEFPYHGNEISDLCNCSEISDLCSEISDLGSEISNWSSSECSDSDCSITSDNPLSEGSSICVEFDVSLHQNDEDLCRSPYDQLMKSRNPYVSYILGDNSCDDDSDMSSDDESDTGCYAESEHLNLPVGGLMMFDFCDDLSVKNLANHVSEDISDDINDVKLVKHPITDEVDCANKEESDKCYETFVNTSQYTNNHHDSPESIDSQFHNSEFNGLCDPDIDVEQAVKDANNRWKVSMENQSAVGTCRSQKKVRFLDNNESSISEVYFVPQKDRKGLREIEAHNRCRFKRIQDLEPVLNPILSASHQTNIYKIYCDPY